MYYRTKSEQLAMLVATVVWAVPLLLLAYYLFVVIYPEVLAAQHPLRR